MPLCRRASSPFISGMTSGTSSRMRKALELSMNNAPLTFIDGANRLAVSASVAPRTMSTPLKLSSVHLRTVTSAVPYGSFLPSLLPLASGRIFSHGTPYSFSTRSISHPTAPVAPMTAIFLSFISSLQYKNKCGIIRIYIILYMSFFAIVRYFIPYGETIALLSDQKRGKSHQRKASRPPLQTTSHPTELAAGSNAR